jgi:hypothetical protein
MIIVLAKNVAETHAVGETSVRRNQCRLPAWMANVKFFFKPGFAFGIQAPQSQIGVFARLEKGFRAQADLFVESAELSDRCVPHKHRWAYGRP